MQTYGELETETLLCLCRDKFIQLEKWGGVTKGLINISENVARYELTYFKFNEALFCININKIISK
jgi:hypothetical protein